MNIDYYIEAAKNMANTSDGGSPAYSFDDVVLVKYETSLELYNEYLELPRKNEEEVARIANGKAESGVRTPKHLGIKREIVGNKVVCWVLQEKAKGKNFSYYCDNSDPKEQIKRQEILAKAPLAHYEKFISDVIALFNLGLELKPKNLFYDEKEGFTIIDLLGIDGKEFDPSSLKDIYFLMLKIQALYNNSRVSKYNKNATLEDLEKSTLLYYEIRRKIFLAMESSILNFASQRRWVLRMMPSDVLNYFEANGVMVGDLRLTEEEMATFAEKIQEIIDMCIRKIADGTHEYWYIDVNTIRIELDSGLNASWLYHFDNKRKREDFSDDYEYRLTCEKDLEAYVKNLFDEELEKAATQSDNAFLIKAKAELDKKRDPNR